MAPEEPVAQQVWQNAKFIRRRNAESGNQFDERKRVSPADAGRQAVEDRQGSAKTPSYPKAWAEIARNRKGSATGIPIATRELDIERKLRTPVLPNYDNMPLAEVIEGLSKLAGINIYLDPRGISQEGVQSDTTVSWI